MARKDVMRVLRDMRPPQEDVEYHRNMLVTRYEFLLTRLFELLEVGKTIGESAVYDRILKTLNQIADITGVKEKPNKQAAGEIDLAAYADLLERDDSK